MYVDDLIYGCIKIINSGKHGKPYNIVFGKVLKLKKQYQIFLTTSIKKNKAKIIFDKNKPVTVKIKNFQIYVLKMKLSFNQK